MGKEVSSFGLVSPTTSEPYRPILYGRVGRPANIAPRQGRESNRIRVNEQGRVARIDQQMEDAAQAFTDSISVADSVNAADPQLVLVFEALDERTDLAAVAALSLIHI